MGVIAFETPTRLPRFRRASEPPAFRITDGDVEIVRQVARRRLARSTHIAALVGRSLDRTNDRGTSLAHRAPSRQLSGTTSMIGLGVDARGSGRPEATGPEAFPAAAVQPQETQAFD